MFIVFSNYFCHIWFRKYFLVSIRVCRTNLMPVSLKKGKFFTFYCLGISSWTIFSTKREKWITHLTKMSTAFCVPKIVLDTECVNKSMNWLVPWSVAMGNNRPNYSYHGYTGLRAPWKYILRENRNTHLGFTESWEALCKRKHEPPFSGIMLIANGHEKEGHFRKRYMSWIKD